MYVEAERGQDPSVTRYGPGPMDPRRRLALPLLAAAVLAAGCGGDGQAKSDYSREVQTAQRAYALSFEKVTDQLTPTSTNAEDRATLAAFAADTGRFVTALKAADVPEEVREPHARLTKVVVGYRAAVERTRAALAGADASERARLRTALAKDFSTAQGQVERAIADINKGLGG